MYGRITNKNISGADGQGPLLSGRFWAYTGDPTDNTVNHEIGHALGLLHTFSGFTAGITSTNEKIKETETCICNCNTTGDLICETEVTPYVVVNGTVDHTFNSKMFNYSNLSIQNLDGILDECGTNYTEISDTYSMYYNLMSYFGTSVRILSPKQIERIKFLNQNSPWVTTTNNPISLPGETINTPITLSEDRIYTEDLIVNSTLNLNNCNIYFTGGKSWS